MKGARPLDAGAPASRRVAPAVSPPRALRIAPSAEAAVPPAGGGMAAAEGVRPGVLAAWGAVLLACCAYALVRYVVVKGESLADVPLHLANKAVAVFSVLLLAAATVWRAAPWRVPARTAGLAAAALHGLWSLALLGPSYYAKLYGAGAGALRLNAAGQLVVASGTAALVALAALKLGQPRTGAARARALRVGLGALGLVVLHCAALGARGWIEPRGWPGGLPPISLLSAAAALAAVAFAAAARRRAARRTTGPA